MRGIKCYFVSVALFAAVLSSGTARAMPIPQYDKMALSDQKHYRALLVQGAADALDGHGDHDQAKKLSALFLLKGTTGGFSQMDKRLAGLRAMNKQNAADPNHKAPVPQVEHAFFLVLKDNGIEIPLMVLLSINQDFEPASPPAAQTQ